jgi:hypothetical protein
LQPEQQRARAEAAGGLTFAEVGTELGVTPAAAKMRFVRALRALRDGGAGAFPSAYCLRPRQCWLPQQSRSSRRGRAKTSGGLVTERALAALPTKAPVMHVVLEQLLGTRMNLETGRQSPVLVRSESWYDQERALLRIRGYRDGRLLADSTVRDAGDSFDAAMVVGFAQAVEVFRKALADGRAHVVGEARIRGRDVYPLDAEPEPGGFQGPVRIAIDKHTYELVQLRAGRRSSSPTAPAASDLVAASPSS